VTAANFLTYDTREISRKVCKKPFVNAEIIDKTYLMKAGFGDSGN